MIINENITNALIAPQRTVKAKVELYKGSTLANTFSYDGAIQEINIDRVGAEGKFFGFGICQKAVIKLRDNERIINIAEGDKLKVYFAANDEYADTLPEYFVSQVQRNEVTNGLTITAHDAINNAANHTVAELNLDSSYTIKDFIVATRNLLNIPKAVVRNISSTLYNIEYPEGANFDGTETIRAALDALAEVLQAVYYMNEKGIIFER